jgi:hypothetical protein
VTSATNPWNRLSLGGKIVLPLLALVVLGAVGMLVLWVSGWGPWATDWLIQTGQANIEILRFVVAATGILLFTVPTAFVIIFMELKLIALMNLRIGPDRTGPWGRIPRRAAWTRSCSRWPRSWPSWPRC